MIGPIKCIVPARRPKQETPTQYLSVGPQVWICTKGVRARNTGGVPAIDVVVKEEKCAKAPVTRYANVFDRNFTEIQATSIPDDLARA